MVAAARSATDCGKGGGHGHVEWCASPGVLPLPRLGYLLGDIRDCESNIFLPVPMNPAALLRVML
jgi:hypothetical protein